jgi:hypothetical protein
MNQLDNQLSKLASDTRAIQPPEFPLALKASLRRRRIGRRIRIGSAVLCPLLVVSAFIWWPRPSALQFDSPPAISAKFVRADPANLPDGPAWQPSTIERARDRMDPDLSGF